MAELPSRSKLLAPAFALALAGDQASTVSKSMTLAEIWLSQRLKLPVARKTITI